MTAIGTARVFSVLIVLMLLLPPHPYATRPEAPTSAVDAGTPCTMPIGSSLRAPAVLICGADGSLWFLEPGRASIARLTMAGRLSEFPMAGLSDSSMLIEGQDGNLWATEPEQDIVARITNRGMVTAIRLRQGSFPNSLAAGPDGNVWATERDGGRIARIAPSGALTEFPVKWGSGSPAIGAGPDGNIWFADGILDPGSIGRITPDGTITEFFIPFGENMYAPVPLRDGKVWVGTTSSEVVDVTPSGTLLRSSDGYSAAPLESLPSLRGNRWSLTRDGTLHVTTPYNAHISLNGAELGRAAGFKNTSLLDATHSMIVGPDGDLWWIGDTTSGYEGRSVPAGHVAPSGESATIALPPPLPPSTRRGERCVWTERVTADAGGITPGPDGALWTVGSTGAWVSRLSKDGTLRTCVLPDNGSSFGKVGNIVTGPDGNLWYLRIATDAAWREVAWVGRLAPSGALDEFPLPKGNGVSLVPPLGAGISLVVGHDNALWFAAGSYIGRLTTDGRVRLFPVPHGVSTSALAISRDGVIWALEGLQSASGADLGSAIGRFIPPYAHRPQRLSRTFPLPKGWVAKGIAAGADGNIWFTETTHDSVGRITPLGRISTFPVARKDMLYWEIVAGQNGNLWVRVSRDLETPSVGGAPSLGRVTLAGVITLFSPYDNSDIATLSAGPDGNVYWIGTEIGRVYPTGQLSLLHM